MLINNSNANDILRLAIEQNSIQGVIDVFNTGADINYKDDDDITPLHHAVEKGNLEIVKFLIQNNADINCKNYRYETPLHYAVEQNHLEIAEYLINHGADIESQDVFYGTPLRYAVIEKKVYMVKLLIKYQANINYQDITDSSWLGHRIGGNLSPLHIAISQKNSEIVKLFIENGVDLQYQDSQRNTYLLWAGNLIQNNHNIGLVALVDIIKLLIEHGIDTNVTNQEGKRFNTDELNISNEQKETLRNTKPDRKLVFQNLSARAERDIDLISKLPYEGIDYVNDLLINKRENPNSYKESLKNRLTAGVEEKLNELSDTPTMAEINNIVKLIEGIKSNRLSVPISLHEAAASAIATHVHNINR